MRVYRIFHSYLLFPLSLIYWGVIYWRDLFYEYGFFIRRRLLCHVISVGNITVGGTGKTPTVIYLANYLKSIGKKSAILSRGYGRLTSGTVLVTDGYEIKTKWEDVGDESYLMALKLNLVPIVVDEDRFRGGKFLIKKFNPDVILLDDGFQHQSLIRDLDLVLVNSRDTKLDHKLIPYGILREPWLNIKRGSAIILTKINLNQSNPFLLRKVLEAGLPIFRSSVKISISPLSPVKLKSMNNCKVFIVSAIGDSYGFKRSIEKLGCDIVGEKVFPDHFKYSESDWNSLETLSSDADYIITTEKDWVKIKLLTISKSIIVIEMDLEIKPRKHLNILIDQCLNKINY